MAQTDFNLFSQIARIYKGYLLLHDGSNTFRYEMLIKLDIVNSANLVPMRAWNGDLKYLSTGATGTATILVPQTADLVDTADYAATNPTKDKKTTSYFIDRMWSNEAVEFTFEGIRVADAAAASSSKNIHYKFKGILASVNDVRDPATGAQMHEFSVQITSHEELRRRA